MKAVRLTDTEIAMLTACGKMRYNETSQHGMDHQQDQRQNGLEMSIIGAITEYAVAKHLQVFFDLNCDYAPPFPPDLVSKAGNTIDVKCTRKQGGNLNAVLRSVKKPVDIYILTEYRKTIKATIMAACGEKTESAKETYAYAHESYRKHLRLMADAVAEAERLRWLMVAAEAKIQVWRSLESSARSEGRSTT